MIAAARLEKAKQTIKDGLKNGKPMQISPSFVLLMISELQRLYLKQDVTTKDLDDCMSEDGAATSKTQ
jgi:hypothetical protein